MGERRERGVDRVRGLGIDVNDGDQVRLERRRGRRGVGQATIRISVRLGVFVLDVPPAGEEFLTRAGVFRGVDPAEDDF